MAHQLGEERMPIERWHGGKIILVWLLGGFVALAGLGVGAAITEIDYDYETVGGVVAVGTVAAAFLACVRITWRWLSARERSD